LSLNNVANILGVLFSDFSYRFSLLNNHEQKKLIQNKKKDINHPTMPMHAYYSIKQYHQNKTLYIYLNEKNEKIRATTITSIKLEEMNRFDDMVYLGEVVKYVETQTKLS